MIARIWHGKTNIQNYNAYAEFLKAVAVPDYDKVPGFKSLYFLRNIKDNEGHFYLITIWDDLDAIKRFAGEDFEVPKYYPEDKKFLLEFEDKATHYELFANK